MPIGNEKILFIPGTCHKPEEIVAKLRQVDVLVSQGKSVADAVIIAVGVNADGRREVAGMDIGPSEACAA
jgi:hypothetical protein